MNKSKGFTIIELIVVIAIIAVLATIVLVNVTQYINRGKDAAIKGNLSSLLINSAVYVDENATYAGFGADTSMGCAGPVSGAITDADSTLICTLTANEDVDTWAACAQLVADSGDYFCVDASGKKIQVTGTCAALDACP
ncbi:MAG: hypothetical protein A2402_01320 [Candidatus Staskawiczbacteria bacterium RIFOXYC1_FULL_37_43]|nr:MAG: hypothetical protein A2813_02815 [Candidatus Staskawiczbacteria bacterium RIFCSPHIGHO2_01_FULL_37_17]OGZ71698.1 MAG: hypothetical protein A2891_00110 [Candidatus Staskawiczbacteria bacterium RIFCSPLOWO2_01_FULL_37_19]OGZ75392.1 MAG: hypothetical protein A2205_01460 [Candidatus Staskawiczbacteria bacterium RIFOXYA1_FULL_37_15]OGZ77999.1 MAG: hypothetical protein A2280_00220 [Candidatus Staskawiczbacteria bacterium RIFOXYA12_FULL_37_10]OGZ80843.1 MAG: hypothetical protein A2353_01225 [Can